MPPSNWRVYLSDGRHPELEPYRDSADFRNRYREDIALAKDLGVEVFRFGLSWARVEPAQGVIDETGWAFYRDVVSAITAAGMEPMPTLDHFVYPEWIFHQGGWLNPSTVDRFAEYVEVAIREIGSACHRWLVFNEPSVSVLMETKMRGLAPEQSLAMATNLVRAHRRSYELIKAADNDALVSSNEARFDSPRPPKRDPDHRDAVLESHRQLRVG
jgi:beta-glucosidase